MFDDGCCGLACHKETNEQITDTQCIVLAYLNLAGKLRQTSSWIFYPFQIKVAHALNELLVRTTVKDFPRAELGRVRGTKLLTGRIQVVKRGTRPSNRALRKVGL